MLIPKQLSKRKMYVCGGIIALMIFGIFFLLYQNHRLVTKRTPIIFDIPAESSFVDKNLVADKTETNVQQIDISSQSKKIIETTGFEIFSSNKYKALKEQIKIDNQEQTTGRRNPFAL